MGGISGTVGDAVINRCYNTGSVNGNSLIGGISGGLYESSKIQLQNCYNTGKISGNSEVGGIVGISQGGVLTNCYNIGDINANVLVAGGIVGNNQRECSNCYNIGNISGPTRIGGVVGQNDTAKSILKNSYSLEGKCENVFGENLNGGTVESSSIKSETEMKALASTLGSAFKEDTENINNGYPILTWQ